MVVIPCSMSTLSGIAQGSSNNLMERAADVMIKEKSFGAGTRETPLSVIHLQNMLFLARWGSIVPAMPGFYHHPQSVEEIVDFMVGR